MSTKNALARPIIIVLIFVIVLILVACQQTQSAESIHGMWHSTMRFIIFNEDGTWAVAFSRSLLKNNPFDWGTYTFDGELLTISTDDEADSCPGQTGVWEVDFPNESDITFIEVEEECSHRRNDIGKNKYQRYSP